MKNYLVFGLVAILSFLACVFFLNPSNWYGTAAAASLRPANNLVNHLASSITLTNTLISSETIKIILSDSNTIIPTGPSTLLNNSEPISSSLTEVGIKKMTPAANRLLKSPSVHFSMETLLNDTIRDSDEEQVIKSGISTGIITHQQETGSEYTPSSILKVYTTALYNFAQEYDYSTDYAFLINLGMKSGKKRFYVLDLKTGIIINRGLVAHGQGQQSFTLDKSYSNKPGSGCSSLGIYKVGQSYYGGYGKSFRLFGLESSNSNAIRRAIVLHAMNCIPDHEINYPICQSEGCPSLSPKFLQELTPIIKTSKKPILLWIFDPAVDAVENQSP